MTEVSNKSHPTSPLAQTRMHTHSSPTKETLNVTWDIRTDVPIRKLEQKDTAGITGDDKQDDWSL